ncbi:hypothetical protein ECEC1845_2857, partial [Escherichia coli EC1845]
MPSIADILLKDILPTLTPSSPRYSGSTLLIR